jgi:HlyD family secretion protein
VDRVIKKKTWTQKRILTIGGIAAIVVLIAGSYYFTSGKSRLNVDTERITISEIKTGSFQEFIPVNGVVLPITTIYLDAVEGGRVEEKFVEDGAMMQKGQPILKLVNTDLELSLSNQETSVFNVLTQMQLTRNNAEQNTIRQLNQMAEVDNALIEAERVYKLNKHLHEEKAIGLQELKSSENNYKYQQERKKLTEETLKKDRTSGKQQVSQMGQSYSRMQNALALMRRKVGDLIVRAPVDGQLTSLDAEIGQQKNKGERLGQIDVVSGFKVRADIDEHYISRIFGGLMGEVTLSNKTYKLKINKVYTQVTSGRFQVFKVADNGRMAYKVDIQLGRQNPDYYEVLQGLQPGDKVVTSSYENYGNMQELVLKNDK